MSEPAGDGGHPPSVSPTRLPSVIEVAVHYIPQTLASAKLSGSTSQTTVFTGDAVRTLEHAVQLSNASFKI